MFTKKENGRLSKTAGKNRKNLLWNGKNQIRNYRGRLFIAFPYGKKVKKKASVKGISAEDAYNMYGGLG